MLCHAETAEDRQLTANSWSLALLYQAGYGVKIIPAQTSIDGMCRPGNRTISSSEYLAGTLAPQPMNARLDPSAPSVNFFGLHEEVLVIFHRYTPQDPLCCPSAQATIQYTIQLSPPLVVPTGMLTRPSDRN